MHIAKLPAVVAGVAALSLGSWGCATKKHVREAIAPVQKQVNDVQKETADNKTAIGDLDRQVSVADEKASDAGKKASEAAAAASRANDAATQAGQRADGARTMAEQTQASLRGLVDNLDNYKLVDTKKVYFRFGKSDLTTDEQTTLDDVVKNAGTTKNVVIEVEGYTDRVGAKNYNLTLSEKRADAVVRYLAEHQVPLRRIHKLGVGELQDEGRRANKENRRVDVRVFALDTSSTGALQSSAQAPSAQ
ncbi:MAG TPA: OmpA family protein [Bryobacteraceae bacterium]|jgi:outer membrane protein OmpA-like peptidoglycan-associated protein|nr:OmpA family protein [Bryobacteraceae bacterium]